MHIVGVRELKNRLTHFLSLSRQGIPVIVTDRNKPIAGPHLETGDRFLLFQSHQVGDQLIDLFWSELVLPDLRHGTGRKALNQVGFRVHDRLADVIRRGLPGNTSFGAGGDASH